MVNNENLDMIYNAVLNDKELTTKDLSSFGFNSKDLNTLIEQGILIRVKRGIYALSSVDKLFYYGKKLIAQKEYDKASLCFLKCFQIDPSHIATCFQLFLRYIQKKDYKEAFKYFQILYDNNEDETLNSDNNFYLYLLNMITEVPENYRQYARYLKYQDLKINENDNFLQNKIRLSSYRQKFFSALKQLNDLTKPKGNTPSTVLIKFLLNQAIDVQIENRNKISNLIKQEEYEKVVEFYETLSNKHNLSMIDEYTFILVKELLELTSSQNIPIKKIFSTNNLFEAIRGKNYELALNLVIENNEKMNIDNENNSIYLILRKIVNLCEEIKDKSLNKEVQEEVVVNKEEDYQVDFVDVIKYLLNNDIDNSIETLKKYLASIEKSEFEFLIINLIKISLLEKDIAFTKPMTVLTLINSENYHFDISKYIQEFYIKLSQQKYEEARIYLDIITKGNKLHQDNIATEKLLQILEISESRLKSKKDNEKPNLDNKNKQNISVEKALKKQEAVIEEKSIEDKIYKQRNSEKEFLDKKYEELLTNKGIILLKPMNDYRMKNVLQMLNSYKDVETFVIEYENKKQIVLRYRPIIDTPVNAIELMQLGQEAYVNKKYKQCIKNYLEVLNFFDEPHSYIYSRLGLSYMKIGNKLLAIDYLTIASVLAKKEGKNYDYEDLILRLKEEIPQTDIKPRFIMTQEDFDYSDVSDYYGIENFTEINTYIIESGLDVESACKELGLTCEEIDIIKLIYAREFYTKANYEKGDLFLKAFEQSKNKTEKTKKLFEEIRKNKRFYQNRSNISDTQLVLTLLPKKKKNA